MTDRHPVPGELAPSGFFVLRTPLLPIATWGAWSGAEDPAGAVLDAVSEPAVADALGLASPSLAAAVRSGDAIRVSRAVPKLAAYLSRAATRSTPFGLFAGCSVGELGPRTVLQLPARAGYRRRTRLDNDFLSAVVAALEVDPAVRRSLRWSPNTSLYRSAGRWRLAEGRLDLGVRTYRLVAVDDSAAVGAALRRADGGATVAEVASFLAPLFGVSEAGAATFVDELIEAQLLVSDLGVQVTGPEPLDPLVERLRDVAGAEPIVLALEAVRTALTKLDAAGPGATAEDYAAVDELVTSLPATAQPENRLQVDMTKPAPGLSLGPAVAAACAEAVVLLHRLMPRSGESALSRFADDFVERYGDGEVPLVEALDEESGLGFGSAPNTDGVSPLLAGLPFPAAPAEPGAWTRRDAYLLDRCRRLEGGVLELTSDDLDALAEPDPLPLPDALEVFATLAARSPDAVDAGEFRLIVHGASGPPGARLLGRFCHADDELHQRVRDQLRRETANRPEAVFAEIVHLPEGRNGNVLCRPVLRDYEIPFLGRSGAPADRQLPITDLRVSVAGDRVVLRSARLGREVLPRLTSAHHVAGHSLGTYRFLVALQSQHRCEHLGWRWGALAGTQTLPRVTHGRLVLSRARWTLRGRELADLPGPLPRIVALADGDHELVVDLADPLAGAALRSRLRSRAAATFVEVLPRSDELCVTGPEGRFAHELVMPFVRTADVRPPMPRRSFEPPVLRRRFPPGSEWFYAKLYTGTGSADRVLLDVVRPFVEEALREGLADSWFFLRYSDPDWHLRVRLRGDTARLVGRLHDIAEPRVADGTIWRMQLDTYDRELTRYGGDAGMELSEQLFRHDSDAVLGLVMELSGDTGLDSRWRLALAGTDRLLTDFGLGLAEKLAWAQARRDAFAREFRVDGPLTKALGDRYRRERTALEPLLGPAVEDTPMPGLALLEERSRQLVPIASELRRRGAAVESLLASYAHMHANRLLRSDHRAQELVLCDLLHRLYVARSHRQRDGHGGGQRDG